MSHTVTERSLRKHNLVCLPGSAVPSNILLVEYSPRGCASISLAVQRIRIDIRSVFASQALATYFLKELIAPSICLSYVF